MPHGFFYNNGYIAELVLGNFGRIVKDLFLPISADIERDPGIKKHFVVIISNRNIFKGSTNLKLKIKVFPAKSIGDCRF